VLSKLLSVLGPGIKVVLISKVSDGCIKLCVVDLLTLTVMVPPTLLLVRTDQNCWKVWVPSIEG